jgi:hypothetical protein
LRLTRNHFQCGAFKPERTEFVCRRLGWSNAAREFEMG